MSKLQKLFSTCVLPSAPLDEETIEALNALLYNTNDRSAMSFDEFVEQMVGENKSFSSQENVPEPLWALFEKLRFSGIDIRLHIEAAIFLSLLSKNNSYISIYLGYTAYHAKQQNTKDVSLSFVVSHVLPNGAFTDEQVVAMWNSQEKDGNPLDDADEWKRMMYGDDSSGKIIVHLSDSDHEFMSDEQIKALGGPKEPRSIEGKMFFWLGPRYVHTTLSDYELINKEIPSKQV